MGKQSSNIRSFTMSLRSTMSKTDYENYKQFHEIMEFHWNSVWSEHDLMVGFADDKHAIRGKYWNEYSKRSSIDYKSWGLGNNAKYFRILAEYQRSLLTSIKERQTIAKAAVLYGYDKSKIVKIAEVLAQQGEYPKWDKIKLVCDRETMDDYSERTPTLKFDWASQDEQIRTRANEYLDPVNTVLHYHLKLPEGWVNCTVKVPGWCEVEDRTNPSCYHYPSVKRNKYGELEITIAYDAPVSHHKNQENTLGIDLNKVNPFRAAVLRPDGTWVMGLTSSRETERVNEKLRLLEDERNNALNKRDKLEALLKGEYRKESYHKWCNVTNQIWFLESKITNIKDHLAHLDARDMVTLALEYDCGFMNLEDLLFIKIYGSKWPVGQIYSCVQQRAALHGIKVRRVCAVNTSKTDPFNGDHVEPKSDRMMVLSDGLDHDRDDVASLNTAERLPREGVKQRLVDPTQGKGHPTPKRAKPVRRTSKHKAELRALRARLYKESKYRPASRDVAPGSAGKRPTRRGLTITTYSSNLNKIMKSNTTNHDT